MVRIIRGWSVSVFLVGVAAGLAAIAAAPPAFARLPRMDGSSRDAVHLSTGVGDGLFLESVRVSKRFYAAIPQPEDEAGQPTPAKVGEIAPEERAPLDIAWKLGYTYLHQSGTASTTTSQITDDSHSFELGLGFDVIRRLTVDGQFGLQSLAAENFTRGSVSLRFSYAIALRGAARGEVGEVIDPRAEDGVIDARAEYKRARLQEEESRVLVPHDERYPQLRVNGHFNFDRFRQDPSPGGRTAAATLSSTATLEQAFCGPELIFAPTPTFDVRLLALFAYYSAEVNDFTNYQELRAHRSPAAWGLMTEEGLAPALLLFPKRTFHLSAGLDLNEQWTGRLFLNSTMYQASNREPSFSFGAILEGKLSKSWTVGIGLDTTLEEGFTWLGGALRVGLAL